LEENGKMWVFVPCCCNIRKTNLLDCSSR